MFSPTRAVANPMAMACLGSASGGATARRTDGAARPSSRAAGRRIALRAHLRVPRKLSTTIRRIGTAPTSPGPVTERQPNHCQAQRLYLWRGPTQLRGLLLSPNSQAAGRAGAALDIPSVEGRIALSQLCERRQLARRSNRASGESFLAKRSGRGRKLAISSRLRHVTLGPKSILLHATGRQSGTARRFSGLLWSKGLLLIYQTAGGISGNLVHARKGVQPGNEQRAFLAAARPRLHVCHLPKNFSPIPKARSNIGRWVRILFTATWLRTGYYNLSTISRVSKNEKGACGMTP